MSIFVSKARVLGRVFELRKEVLQYLHGRKEDLVKHFSEPKVLTYLSGMFVKLNDINLTMQGPKVTSVDADESVSALKDKLLLEKEKRLSEVVQLVLSNLDNVLENKIT